MAVYVQINCVPNGSTGGIMLNEHNARLENKDISYVFWGRGRDSKNAGEWKFANEFGCKTHALLDRVTGKHGFYSSFATRRLLQRLDEIRPDIVHLHNLHGYYVNIEMLFEWLSKRGCQVEWTLHDCWAFTGHCAYFTYAKCAQWRSRCAYGKPCPQLGAYPKTYSKRSCAWNFEQKKRLFNLIPADRMKLITPSHWLGDLVKQSFLAKYPVEVRYNTVDTSVFRPTPSDFRERYGIGDRFMVLGVACPWSERKGLNDFVRLAGELDSSKYAVVLVGLSKRQIKELSNVLLALPKTENKEKLAEIYSAANVFFNPTTEDNFPTVNLEAEACGVPVVTYDTGGCRETLKMPLSSCIAGPREAFAEIMGRCERLNGEIFTNDVQDDGALCVKGK